MTAAKVLRDASLSTGLAAELAPFPREGSLAERLAAHPFLMAPMAGVSDAAYRMMARAGGASLAYSEMVSVAGIHFGSDKTWELAEPQHPEPDLAVQLFGSDPAQFGEVAAAVSERLGPRLVLIDINMACPVPKVVKNGAGSALLDDSALAARIVGACRAATDAPVTVKIRRGRRIDEDVSCEFARAMQDAGAAAIAVHGRYANQFYRGEASWDVVRRVSAAVDVPVIGSGDVRDASEAVRMLDETGCAGVMVARGSYGNPWLFADADKIRRGEATPVRDVATRLAAFVCHVRLLDATDAHLARARSLASWYFRGMPEAASWRNRAMQCTCLDDYLELASAALSASDAIPYPR